MDKDTFDIVVSGYIVKQGRILLIHHKKLYKWLPPGGHIEENEIPDLALKREMKEELGLKVELVQYPLHRKGNRSQFALPFYTDVHDIKDNHHHYCLHYLCKPLNDDVQISKKEVLSYRWLSSKELSSLVPSLDEGLILTCREAIELMKKFS